MPEEKKEKEAKEEKKKTEAKKPEKAPGAKKPKAKPSASQKKGTAKKTTKKPAASQKKKVEKKAEVEKQTETTTGKATDKEIEEGKGLAAISYISILFLIPMISMRDNKFAMFHAKQSMVLVLSAMVSWLVLFLLGVLTSWLGIGIILILLSYVILFAWLVLMIIGFVKAFSGEYWRIPKIADWADKVKI
ncbi:MAG: DUF4870 domain-containing protein [bacterium]|nr:DUF4870 domain-containing protein [bacterium]